MATEALQGFALALGMVGSFVTMIVGGYFATRSARPENQS